MTFVGVWSIYVDFETWKEIGIAIKDSKRKEVHLLATSRRGFL